MKTLWPALAALNFILALHFYLSRYNAIEVRFPAPVPKVVFSRPTFCGQPGSIKVYPYALSAEQIRNDTLTAP